MGYKRLTDDQEKQLVEEYLKGASVKSLQEKYGFKTKKSITDKVKKYKGEDISDLVKQARDNRKSYQMKFDGVKDEFSAYFLGLMLTDGYIQDNNKFGIDLTDLDVIQFISNVTGKEYKEYEPCGSYGDINNKKKRYRIIFSDNESVENLAKYGVVRNKTHILEKINLFPEEEKFLPYILRGIIDGDGCVFQTGYGAPAVYICSASLPFLEWINDFCVNKLFMIDWHFSKSEQGLYRIDTADQRNILKIISLCYDKPYGMNRKYTKIRETFRDYHKDILPG